MHIHPVTEWWDPVKASHLLPAGSFMKVPAALGPVKTFGLWLKGFRHITTPDVAEGGWIEDGFISHTCSPLQLYGKSLPIYNLQTSFNSLTSPMVQALPSLWWIKVLQQISNLSSPILQYCINTSFVFIFIMHWDSWVKSAWNHHDNSYTVTYFHSHLQGSGVAGDPCHLTFIYLTKGSVAQTPGQTREDKKVLLQRTHCGHSSQNRLHNFYISETGRTGYWHRWYHSSHSAGDQTEMWSSLDLQRIWLVGNSSKVNSPQWNQAGGTAVCNG